MPDVRKFFDKDYLYAYDLDGRDVTVTIERVQQGELVNQGKKSKKPVVYFKGSKKGLALNITNVRTIGAMYGFKSEDWIGKRVTLYPTVTQFGPDTKECIRIHPTKPGASVKDSKPIDPPAEREPGDDVEDKGDAPTEAELRAAGLEVIK